MANLKELIGFYHLIYFSIMILISAQSTNLTEECIVYRSKYRSCHPENGICVGDRMKTEQLIYKSCPVLTQAQKDSVISGREIAQVLLLESITNQTTNAIKAIDIKFAVQIQTSKSFAYIAISNIITYL